MKSRIRNKAGALAVAAIASTLLIYQNCSMPVEGLDGNSFPEFAYDAKPDTIGYMSCSSMVGADPSAYFTFRLGAYHNGGMRLHDDFYRSTANMSTPKKINFLLSGQKNKDIQLQLAVRRASDMVAFAADTRPEEARDYDFIFPPVSNEVLANELVTLQEGERLRSLPGGLDEINRFEGTLNFLDSGVLEESVRSELRRGAYLALTYNPLKEDTNADKTLALSPGDFSENPEEANFNIAYGVGYGLTFQQGNVGTGHPARVMGSVKEVDLVTKQSTGSAQWICPPSMRFKIVRPDDVGVSVNGNLLVACNRVLDPQNIQPTSELGIIRRVLRVEDWYIDMANHCIVPKPGIVGACYGEDLDIEYTNQGCGGTKACTHFFSVCYQPAQ